MRAVRVAAVGEVQLCEIEELVPAAAEVLLRVDACGICGTDRHIFHGDYASAKPVTLGHEFAGTVVTSGAVPEGSRVAVDPNISCGSCRSCRRGDTCLCPQRVALGVDLDGGLAEYAVVPRSQIYALPDDLPVEFGALCEPLACCLRGLDQAHLRPGMSVVVLGGGVAGQLMVQLARLAGAGAVVLVTRQASRRALAEHCGASATLDPRAGPVVDRLTSVAGLVPGGADVVFECVGSAETFEQSVAAAARGGTVVVFGVAPEQAMARVSPFEIFARELRIVGSYLNPLTHGRAVELAASGRLALAPLISDRLGLEDLPQLIASSPAPGEVKAMFVR